MPTLRRTPLRKLRAGLRLAEARRDALLARVLAEPDGADYPDVTELDEVTAQADALRATLDAEVRRLRASVWSGDSALQARRARELARLRARSRRPGLFARLMTRLRSSVPAPG